MSEIRYLKESETEDDLKRYLLEGNNVWMQNKDGSSDYNNSLGTIVLACMDSRVPVERIFNTKPGELLVLRNAGNEITEDVLRSVLVGIYEIHAKYIIILGHTRCGMAIKGNSEIEERIKKEMGEDGVLNKISSITDEEPFKWFGFFQEGKWSENALEQAEFLKEWLIDLLPEERLPCILPALYDIESGEVKFL